MSHNSGSLSWIVFYFSRAHPWGSHRCLPDCPYGTQGKVLPGGRGAAHPERVPAALRLCGARGLESRLQTFTQPLHGLSGLGGHASRMHEMLGAVRTRASCQAAPSA